MRLYCGVSERQWNHHRVNPGPFACVSPVYGRTEATRRETPVTIPEATLVLQDSGAFSDGPGQRLDFKQALERQIEHQRKYSYTVEARASYDLLIDEKWHDGRRKKSRWTKNEARQAVDETIAAAEFMRTSYTGRRVLSAQGVTPAQYLECVKQIIPILAPCDILGLGGWCISGQIPKKMMITFSETMTAVIPHAAKRGVRRVHIWGVIDSEFLGPLLWLCDRYNIELSTDSAGPSFRPARSGLWGYKGWRNPDYRIAPTNIRGMHRIIHVAHTRQFLANGLRQSIYYCEPKTTRIKISGKYIQAGLL